MDWLLLIVEIASIIAVFLLGLFTKNYLPSYMEKKGENLATKEDVKEITRRTEEVQQEFRQEMARFSKDLVNLSMIFITSSTMGCIVFFTL